MLTKKIIAAAVALGAFTFTPQFTNFNFVSTAQAEIKTYTGVGKCVQGDLMTEEQSKKHARAKAEMNAKEQAGVYISGYTEVENLNLTKNDIQIVTNNIISIVGDVKYNRKPFDLDGVPSIVYTATLQTKIDTDGITEYLNRADKENISKLESTNEEFKNELDKIDILIERYNKATSKAEKDKIRAEFNKVELNITVVQKIEQGNNFIYQGKYQEAIRVYKETIDLNPTFAMAYNNRAVAYQNLKQYEKASADFNKVKEIKSNNSRVKNNTNPNAQKYEADIARYSQAIALNPNDAKAYHHRAWAYYMLKQYNSAVSDYTSAISIDPYYARAHKNRGMVYNLLKQYDAAIADYSKAIELNPNYTNAYANRADVYERLGYKEKAKKDWAKYEQLKNKK